MIGGAYSRDKEYRLLTGLPWFPDEQPSAEIRKRVESALEIAGYSVDYVLSHTAPMIYVPLREYQSKTEIPDYSTEEWLDQIEKKLNYKKWYFGHFHENFRYPSGEAEILYEEIKELGAEDYIQKLGRPAYRIGQNVYFTLESGEEDGYGRICVVDTPHRNSRNPIHNDDIIYTPEVTVFKSDTANPVLLPEKDWYTVDVITCAAPNLRERPGNSYNAGEGDRQIKISDKELLSLHEKRLKRILDVAVAKGDEVVILGAFGCGAFKNKPEVVAQAAQKVVKEYRKAFQVIEFAVYCGMRDDTNYRIFDRRMKTLM